MKKQGVVFYGLCILILIVGIAGGGCKKPGDSQNTPAPVAIEQPMEQANEIMREQEERVRDAALYHPYVPKSSRYLDYHFEFEKLAEDEILVYSWANGFELGARNTVTGQERTIGSDWKVSYGKFQLSGDRKQGFFLLSVNASRLPLFFVDGPNGSIHYMMNVNGGARSTPDMKYLLYEEGDYILLDLQNVRFFRRTAWPVEESLTGSSILRSIDPDYDYRIERIHERQVYTIAYYSIEQDSFVIVFNAFETDNPEKNALDYETKSDEELAR